jgi:serine/threonine-protein kinase
MIGQILGQRYKIIKQLGVGGFGETYLAEGLINLPGVTCKPKYVVKRLLPQKKDDPDTVRRFKEEAAILHILGKSHDQIPKLIEYFEENLDFYLVQEYIDGQDLRHEITPGKPWSEDQVIELLQEILEVLAFVHQQQPPRIHRDIKPTNIMRRYSDCKVMLIDFGAAKEVIALPVNVQGQTSSSIEIGTRCYMPSEQSNGHPTLASDIYAVGITAIEALTGLAPNHLPKDSSWEIIWCDRAQVSDSLAEILTKMVRYDFRQRYQSATEALQALTTARVTPPTTTSVALPQPFIMNNKWGYRDETGQVVIQPQYVMARNFSEGLARVMLDEKQGYIDQKGGSGHPASVCLGWNFSEGLARVMNNSKFGYINKEGEFVNKSEFDGALDFSEGLAAVKIGSKWGYIDQTGQEVIKPQFDDAYGFSGGQAQVLIGWHKHFIDKTGKIISR